jgi:hypothetical protein
MHDLPRKLPIWPGAPGAAEPRKHVLQRRGPDCAIAAAATIAGVPYDEAASMAFSLREDGLGGMRAQRVQEFLYRLTDKPWRIRSLARMRVRLCSMVFPQQLSVACIASHSIRPLAHAFAARQRVIYDGSLEKPVSPRDHPLKDWYLAWLIETDLA